MLIFYRVTILLLTAWLAVVNVGIYQAPAIGSAKEGKEVMAELRYLEKQVHEGLGDRMQALFPEGSAFTYALYGSAWCGYAERAVDTAITRHALKEAEWAYARMDDPMLKGRFPTVMEPRYGAFYAGWRNYLLARIIAISGPEPSLALLGEFDRQSAELKLAYARSESPFLSSYDGMAWPADNVVAVASLALHQRLRQGMPDNVLARWLRQTAARLDKHGCIPHAWDPLLDLPVQEARGSSQSLINCFLATIDPTFARVQFDRYRELFLDTRLGIPMIREFASGTNGSGDVDSGPVIFGAGSSATIVGPGAFRMNMDVMNGARLDASIEAFGMPIGTENKRYIFGSLPIADLFIVWTRTMNSASGIAASRPSFAAFHAWSVLLASLCWAPIALHRWKRRCRIQEDH